MQKLLAKIAIVSVYPVGKDCQPQVLDLTALFLLYSGGIHSFFVLLALARGIMGMELIGGEIGFRSKPLLPWRLVGNVCRQALEKRE
jgi:hypothetical protein